MQLNPWHILLVSIAGWMNREQNAVIEYLQAENRILRELLGNKRPRLNDDQRRRLAVLGKALGRKLLSTCCCIVTPDTILRWHRKLIAMKYDGSSKRSPGRPRVLNCIRRLVIRMAQENRIWGYDRIQGALANVGHTICATTVKRILKSNGIEPVTETLKGAGVQCVKLPPKSLNLNAYAERFVRSIKSECLDRMIFFGGRHLRHAIREYVAHYHAERSHQGIGNKLIERSEDHPASTGSVLLRTRLGGMLRYYYRPAASRSHSSCSATTLGQLTAPR